MNTGTMTATSTCHTAPAASEGDVEDAIAEEYPQGPVTSKVMIKGLATTKPKALCL